MAVQLVVTVKMVVQREVGSGGFDTSAVAEALTDECTGIIVDVTDEDDNESVWAVTSAEKVET